MLQTLNNGVSVRGKPSSWPKKIIGFAEVLMVIPLSQPNQLLILSVLILNIESGSDIHKV